MPTANKRPHTEVRVRGFARLQLWEKDRRGKYRLVGNSGWLRNTVTTDNGGGLTAYIAATVGAVAGSKNPTHLVLATQTAAVNATQTSLLGETRVRKALTASTIATGTLRMTAQWSSSDNTAAITIGAIGVYNHLTTGTMAAGAIYNTSQWASNQDLSATYELRFA
jgi:hypothetical protein